MIKLRSFKHIKRYRQIVSTFSKFGLKNLISFIEVLRTPQQALPPRITKTTTHGLRLALQELGPTFIKGGQLLSSRSDLLPKPIIKELQKLLDEVTPVDTDLIRKQIENELGGKIENVFSSFEKQPLASASLAQVHKAILKNGQTVALKVQRPGIEQIINTDVDVLYGFASALQDRLSYLKTFNLTEIVAEFEKNIKKEINFELEGLNIQKIAKNLEEFSFLKLPKVYSQYSTKKLLCLEYVEGYKITEIDKLKKSGVNTKELAWKIFDIYAKQVYIDGFFQADPHIGNIFIKKNGLVQLIDFGSVGALDEHLRKEIALLIFHFIFKDGEQATESLLRIGKQKPHAGFGALRNSVSELIADYSSLPTKYFSLGQGLLDMIKISSKFNIELPTTFGLASRTLLLLDYLVRILDPDFNYHLYLEHLTPILMYERLQAAYSPQRIARNFVELSDFTNTLPSKLNYFIDKVIKDELHVIFRHEGLEKITNSLSRTGYLIAISLIILGLSSFPILIFLSGFKTPALMLAILILIIIVYLLYHLLRNIKWQ